MCYGLIRRFSQLILTFYIAFISGCFSFMYVSPSSSFWLFVLSSRFRYVFVFERTEFRVEPPLNLIQYMKKPLTVVTYLQWSNRWAGVSIWADFRVEFICCHMAFWFVMHVIIVFEDSKARSRFSWLILGWIYLMFNWDPRLSVDNLSMRCNLVFSSVMHIIIVYIYVCIYIMVR